MITLIIFLPLLSAFVILFILGYVVGQRKKHDINRAFGFLFLDLFLVEVLEFLFRLSSVSGEFDERILRFLGVCVVFNGFLILNSIFAMAGKRRSFSFYLSALGPLAGTVYVLIPQVHLVERVSVNINSGMLPTPWFAILMTVFVLPPGACAYFVAIREYRKTSEMSVRQNYRYLFAGTAVAASFYLLATIVLPLAFKWYAATQCSTFAFPIFALVLFRAVTKHKFLSFDREKELAHARQIESLGLLAGGIAHDFNNLLTGILASFSLIKNIHNGTNAAEVEIAERGIRASEQAAKLTKQLLTFAKGGDPVLEAVDIQSVISEAVQFVLSGSSCTFHINGSAEAEGILADQGQIAQVFHNLGMNARQAMPEGGTITATLGKRFLAGGEIHSLPAGDYVEIVFADTGKGIDPAYKDRIFEPYFTTKPGGSGLGLATTFSILKRHKGHISVASEMGRGTSFTLLLPVTSAPPSVALHVTSKELPSSSGKILVVDDEQLVRVTFERLLSFLGFAATCVQNADEALRTFAASRAVGSGFSCCILDLTMPGGMSGKDLGARLLQEDPALKIIISSGYHDDPVIARYRDYGFAGVLPKPFAVEDLRGLLSVVLSTKSPSYCSGN